MRATTDRRLAVLEQRFHGVAEARRREQQSRQFWQRMKELSEASGHDLVGGAFPRGYDPTVAPRRRPTVRDRMNAIIAETQALIAGGRADPTGTPDSVASQPIPFDSSREAAGITSVRADSDSVRMPTSDDSKPTGGARRVTIDRWVVEDDDDEVEYGDRIGWLPRFPSSGRAGFMGVPG